MEEIVSLPPIEFFNNDYQVVLDLRYTPISKKYSREEIRKMIVDNGGYAGFSI